MYRTNSRDLTKCLVCGSETTHICYGHHGYYTKIDGEKSVLPLPMCKRHKDLHDRLAHPGGNHG